MAKAKTSSKTLNLLPTPGYILIEPVAIETKTTGGIYLPESATTEKPQRGKVLAVGADEVTDNGTKKTSPVKVGEKVIYKKWGGNEVKEDGRELLFVKFDDILATIK